MATYIQMSKIDDLNIYLNLKITMVKMSIKHHCYAFTLNLKQGHHLIRCGRETNNYPLNFVEI